MNCGPPKLSRARFRDGNPRLSALAIDLPQEDALGIASGDPVVTALTAALPGINTGNGDLTNAENLYALLTGRVSNISGNVNVDEKSHQYNQYQPATQRWAFRTSTI